MKEKFELEVIAFTLESVFRAEQAGAHRIELCDNPPDGGTTPSYGMIRRAREVSSLQLFPIIRPRGGDFLYSSDELEIMQHDIRLCRDLGCDGVVIGVLTPEGDVNRDACCRLVELAYPMSVTFHRAFDRVRDPRKALEDVIDAGCERILTSGCKPTAMEGIELLQQLVRQADHRIQIMPGSGVRSSNIIELAGQTGACQFHTSARQAEDTRMHFLSPSMKERLQRMELDIDEVKKIRQRLSDYFQTSMPD